MSFEKCNLQPFQDIGHFTFPKNSLCFFLIDPFNSLSRGTHCSVSITINISIFLKLPRWDRVELLKRDAISWQRLPFEEFSRPIWRSCCLSLHPFQAKCLHILRCCSPESYQGPLTCQSPARLLRPRLNWLKATSLRAFFSLGCQAFHLPAFL